MVSSSVLFCLFVLRGGGEKGGGGEGERKGE